MFETIASQFRVCGTFVKAKRLGTGLINDTYLCEYKENEGLRKYVFQRVNLLVFKKPKQVMKNIEIVTKHILEQMSSKGLSNAGTITPTLLYTEKGNSYFYDNTGAFWRAFHFIESGRVFDTVVDAEHAFEIGCGLGKFQSLVSDLAPQKLSIIIPGFHDTPKYLRGYDKALKDNIKNRSGLVGQEAAFVKQRRLLAPILMDLMNSGNVPLRVVHNDPKVNNIMIHTTTHKALCMLDLDTVMPGIVHFDYADCVRSAANPSGEDERDLEKVDFNMLFFEAMTSGYLQEAGRFLTREEIKALPVSIKVITFELGLRFLADYLRGDTYFKVSYPTQNLVRAQVQFKLLERMESKTEQISSLAGCTAEQ